MPNVSVKRAMELYRKAHKGLTAQEEADAHKGEELLKKKGIVAKRVTGSTGKDKFAFSRKKTSSKPKKKKLQESKLKSIKNKIYFATRRPTYKGSGEVNSMGMPIGDESPMSNIDWAKKAAGDLKSTIVDLIKGRRKKQQPYPEEEGIPF